MSNFAFLTQWPDLAEHAQQAEALLQSNPRGSCFYSRYTLERMVAWMYESDNWLQKPKYDNSLNTLINQASFKQALGHSIFPKIKVVQKSGNQAVHSERKVKTLDAIQTLKELHHILYWFYRTYTTDSNPSNQVFSLESVPKKLTVDAELIDANRKQLAALQTSLENKDAEHQKALETERKQNADLRQQLTQLQSQVSEQKQHNAKATAQDSHNYNEAETRQFIIDQYLTEMGWDLDAANVKEFEVQHMPNKQGVGFVDYVLWDDNGLPLAVVEAKRTTKDPKVGRQQAVLYADCLQKMYGQRPLIYYTNGYEIHFWDDCSYPSRAVQGFLSKDQMKRLIDRRKLAKPLHSIAIDTNIAGLGRSYQQLAIKRVCEQFEEHKQRKSLLVMATGTGKTRTTIAIVDVLMRAGLVKNALFLADRNALVSQAKKEFNKLLKDSNPSILSSGAESLQGRVFLSTYPTMMNILSAPPESRLFGVGHFDLVIVDEAHRSVYKKYRYIFDYFDSLLLGLTATPKSELDKNTYEIFDMPDGNPTFAYELGEAVKDGFLVPPRRVDVGLGFVREGIKYADLTPDEQAEWEANEELNDRDEVLPSEVNQFLFNTDTVDKALEVLFEHGIKVASGDRLAKTIIFAANNNHAEFIVERINANYAKFKGKFARTITYKENYAETLIEEFKGEKEPLDPNIPLTLAVSVDMLDTGIDVPEVANLMFFKVIKSKVKFMQMLGRGTRLCPSLFGPNSPEDDKQDFKVFDCCSNFEYFDMNPDGAKDSLVIPLNKVIFEKRLDIADLLKKAEDNEFAKDLRQSLLTRLHNQVTGMNWGNFMVRPKRQLIEPYQKLERWQNLNDSHLAEIKAHLSDLPTDFTPTEPLEVDQEMALQFDNLLLSMQLALLDKTGISDHNQARLIKIAEQLEAKSSIPAVAQQLEWIQYIQTANFWQDVTLEELEHTRKHLRLLLQYIEKQVKSIVYTTFIDSPATVNEQEGHWIPQGEDLELYRKKVEAYIRGNQHDLTIQRIKRNENITDLDLQQLDKKCFEASGLSSWEAYQETIHPDLSVDLFVRKLVGLDRQAALQLFSDYLDQTRFNANQIQFMQQVIDYLTVNGFVPNIKTLTNDSYFTSQKPNGILGFFDITEVQDIKDWLEQHRLLLA